jgi:hypothetical protein
VVNLTLTSLYIPLTKFSINNEDGFNILYNNLIQSGPAYRLIVHDSPSWHEIRDKIQNPEEIVILDEKKAEYYKQASLDFFAPVTEDCPVINRSDGQVFLTANLLSDMRRALAHILIACDYKARILEEDFFDYDNPLVTLTQIGVPDDCVNRVRVVDNLLKGYYQTNVPTVFMNRDKVEIENLKKALMSTEMQTLSTLNYKFGEIVSNKQVLIRDIAVSIKDILRSPWFTIVLNGGAIGLSYCLGLSQLEGTLTLMSTIGATALSQIKLKEYVPPIQEPPSLYSLAKSGTFSSQTQTFNDEIQVPIKRQSN